MHKNTVAELSSLLGRLDAVPFKGAFQKGIFELGPDKSSFLIVRKDNGELDVSFMQGSVSFQEAYAELKEIAK